MVPPVQSPTVRVRRLGNLTGFGVRGGNLPHGLLFPAKGYKHPERATNAAKRNTVST